MNQLITSQNMLTEESSDILNVSRSIIQNNAAFDEKHSNVLPLSMLGIICRFCILNDRILKEICKYGQEVP